MQYSYMAMGAAVLLALTPSVVAVGSAHVVNNCTFPVYYASIVQGVHSEMKELPAEGFSAPFSLPNVGVSIKIAPSLTEKPTQFEYTWGGGNIFYDISNIDGNPFSKYGMLLQTSGLGDTSRPTCKDVTCRPGETSCFEAYNLPDDRRTMVCRDDVDLTMTLCPTPSLLMPLGHISTGIIHRHKRTHARHLPKA